MELGHHISQRYNEELEDIRNKVLHMGGLVEAQTSQAIKALLDSDQQLAKKVAKKDNQINAMEVEIDEECTQVIARRQPTASDLRLVIAVVKVITDLERIGDEAEKIARYSKKLAKKSTAVNLHPELTHLSSLVLRMLRDTLDAFARLDVEQAIKTLEQDPIVNNEFDRLTRLLITFMMEDARNIKSTLRVSWCARGLERIADHTLNICEYLIYLVEGQDVRHNSLEEIHSKYFPQGPEEPDAEA